MMSSFVETNMFCWIENFLIPILTPPPRLTRANFNDEFLDAEVARRGRRDGDGDFMDVILLRAEHKLDLLWHIVDEVLKIK